MTKEGPGLLEMQVALCFALSIVVEMTIRTTPILAKMPQKIN